MGKIKLQFTNLKLRSLTKSDPVTKMTDVNLDKSCSDMDSTPSSIEYEGAEITPEYIDIEKLAESGYNNVDPDDYKYVYSQATVILRNSDCKPVLAIEVPVAVMQHKESGECLNENNHYIALPVPPFGGGGISL